MFRGISGYLELSCLPFLRALSYMSSSTVQPTPSATSTVTMTSFEQMLPLFRAINMSAALFDSAYRTDLSNMNAVVQILKQAHPFLVRNVPFLYYLKLISLPLYRTP